MRPAESKTALAGAAFRRAESLCEKGSWRQAIPEYQKCVELDPKHAEAHHNLGNLMRKRGDYSDAKLHFDEAIRLNPSLRGRLAQRRRGSN